MKQFFKYVFASTLGFFIAFMLCFIVISLIIVGIVASADSKKQITVGENSILHIEFQDPVTDRAAKDPLSMLELDGFSSKKMGLNDICVAIKKAERDANIKGIFLDLSSFTGGFATAEEIRTAISEFKKSGKFIISYSESYNQLTYYLASVADQVYLNPQGQLDFRGFKAQLLFFKGTLDKLEIEPQIIRHGSYKSFAEPFTMDKMSDENRLQMSELVNSFYNHYLKGISSFRQIGESELKNIADSLLCKDARDAWSLGLVDGISYKDKIIDILKEHSGVASTEKAAMVKLRKYFDVKDPEKSYAKEKIAVIYASGGINQGKGDDESIGSDDLTASIRKAREDDKVKAVVLRVNSPGGSALASDIIWREVAMTKTVKPVVVSMGDVAASGGYYISCGADKIVAQPNTITGSIGVIGLLFNAQNMLKNKLGVTVDTYKTGTYADLGSIARPLTSNETKIIQGYVDAVYDTFITRVASGRKLTLTFTDSIGGGRVYTGIDALKLGLVDTLGGLDVALAIAAEKAGITKYRIKELPEQKDPLSKILEELTNGEESRVLEKSFGIKASQVKYANQLIKMNGIMALWPYIIFME